MGSSAQDSHIQEIRELAINAAKIVICDELINSFFGSNQDPISLTVNSIEQFNKNLIMLNDASVAVNEKYSAVISVKSFNHSLKLLRNMVSERDFNIFYNYYFLDKNRNVIAYSSNLDVTTIARIKYRVLEKLSIILYPDLKIIDMFG